LVDLVEHRLPGLAVGEPGGEVEPALVVGVRHVLDQDDDPHRGSSVGSGRVGGSAAQRWVNLGVRFSRNAAIPSARSASANVALNACFSRRRPSSRDVSWAARSAFFAAWTTGRDFAAIVSATRAASSRISWAGTTRETR